VSTADSVIDTPTFGLFTTLHFAQGDDVAKAVQLAVAGAPLDLGGSTIEANIGFPSPLTLSNLTGGIKIRDAHAGLAILKMAGSATAAVPCGGYPLEVSSIDAGGRRRRRLTGRIVITPAVPQNT
jgi:hypothetical protein